MGRTWLTNTQWHVPIKPLSRWKIKVIGVAEAQDINSMISEAFHSVLWKIYPAFQVNSGCQHTLTLPPSAIKGASAERLQQFHNAHQRISTLRVSSQSQPHLHQCGEALSVKLMAALAPPCATNSESAAENSLFKPHSLAWTVRNMQGGGGVGGVRAVLVGLNMSMSTKYHF